MFLHKAIAKIFFLRYNKKIIETIERVVKQTGHRGSFSIIALKKASEQSIYEKERGCPS